MAPGPIPEDEAAAFHRTIAMQAPGDADLVDVVRRVHERAWRKLPWCGPLDTNPANVMRAADGRLVMADLFTPTARIPTRPPPPPISSSRLARKPSGD